MRAFNLIPADERGGASLNGGKSGGSAFVVLGLLGVLAIFALLYGQASRQISSQTDKIATLNAQAQAAQAQAQRLAPYVSFMTMHEQRVQAVDQLVDSRFDWAHAFHELGRVLPPAQARSAGAVARPRPAPTRPRAQAAKPPPRPAQRRRQPAARARRRHRARVCPRRRPPAASPPSRSPAAPPARRWSR
jgi:hypothetical protein